jgi:hypothetical protein
MSIEKSLQYRLDRCVAIHSSLLDELNAKLEVLNRWDECEQEVGVPDLVMAASAVGAVEWRCRSTDGLDDEAAEALKKTVNTFYTTLRGEIGAREPSIAVGGAARRYVVAFATYMGKYAASGAVRQATRSLELAGERCFALQVLLDTPPAIPACADDAWAIEEAVERLFEKGTDADEAFVACDGARTASILLNAYTSEGCDGDKHPFGKMLMETAEAAPTFHQITDILLHATAGISITPEICDFVCQYTTAPYRFSDYLMDLLKRDGKGGDDGQGEEGRSDGRPVFKVDGEDIFPATMTAVDVIKFAMDD